MRALALMAARAVAGQSSRLLPGFPVLPSQPLERRFHRGVRHRVLILAQAVGRDDRRQAEPVGGQRLPLRLHQVLQVAANVGRRCRQARAAVVDAPAGEIIPAGNVGPAGVGDQLRASALAPASTSATASMSISTGTISCEEVSLNVVLQRPCLDQLEESGRAPGQQRKDLPETGPFHLAGLTPAVLVMRWALQAGHDLEVGGVLSLSVSFDVAAAGLGAIADWAFSGSHMRPPAAVGFISEPYANRRFSV